MTQENYWTNSEQADLVKVLTILVEGQNLYGKQVDIRATLNYYRLKLERRYTVQQVIAALDIYTDSHNTMPTPADIIGILSPEKPRITEAQFVEAQKWQERNNWPIMSEAQDVINAYREQQRDEMDHYKRAAIENHNIANLISGSIKRIDAS